MLNEIGKQNIPGFLSRVKDKQTHPPDGFRPSRLQELRSARQGDAPDLSRGADLARHQARPAARAGDGSSRSRSRTITSSRRSSIRTSILLGHHLPGDRHPDLDVHRAVRRRTVGWISAVIEDPDEKIGRPRQMYSGQTERPYKPLHLRGIELSCSGSSHGSRRTASVGDCPELPDDAACGAARPRGQRQRARPKFSRARLVRLGLAIALVAFALLERGGSSKHDDQSNSSLCEARGGVALFPRRRRGHGPHRHAVPMTPLSRITAPPSALRTVNGRGWPSPTSVDKLYLTAVGPRRRRLPV